MELNATDTAPIQQAAVSFSAFDYVVFAFFLGISAAVGVFFSCRSKKTTKDYFLGNKQLGPITIGISTGVSFMSTSSLVGFPAEMYVNGYSYSLCIISGCLGSTVVGACFVGNIVQSLGISSLDTYFFARYRSRLLCWIGKMMVLLAMLHYMGVCMLGSVLAFGTLTGGQISFVWALVIGGGVGMFYTSLGGLKAVIWSDVLQASFMMLGVVVVVAKSIADTPGGMATIIDLNKRYERFHAPDWSLNPTVRHSMWGLVIGNFFNWMVYVVQPAYVQRMAALRSKRDCYIAATVGGLIWVFFCSFPSWAGINIFGYYISKGCDIYARGWAEKNDILAYYVRDRVAFPGFQGLFLASLFAGSLSSLSSALNAFSALVWEDIIKPRLPFEVTEVHAVVCSKVIVVLGGVLGMTWCFGLHCFGQLILQLSLSFDAAVYGAYFSLFVFSVTVSWINTKGAILAIFATFVFTGWLGIGSLFRGNSTRPQMMTTTEKCPMNATTSIDVDVPKDRSLLDAFYSISYLHFMTLCMLVFLGVALVVSLCTGRKKVEDPRLLLPCVSRLRCCGVQPSDAAEGPKVSVGEESAEGMLPLSEQA